MTDTPVDSPAGAPGSTHPTPNSLTDDVTSGARHEPLAEKPHETRRRSWVVASFWVLVLTLGLPIWWQTTSIYRADLPLAEMQQWAEGRSCRPVFPLPVTLDLPSVAVEDQTHLLRLTQHALDDLNEFAGYHHIRLTLADPKRIRGEKSSPPPPPPVLTVRLGTSASDIASCTSSLDAKRPYLDIHCPPSAIPSHLSEATSSVSLASYLATTLHHTFDEERAIISYLLSSYGTGQPLSSSSSSSSAITSSSSSGSTSSSPSSPSSSSLSSTTLTPDLAKVLAKWSSRTLKFSSSYHLTFSLFTGGSIPNQWEIDSALQTYILPLLEVLAPVHNFTVDTQIQLYSSPSVHSSVLKQEDLSSFINFAEWPLTPSIGGAPTVNFILYVGDQTIQGAGEQGSSGHSSPRSWLIPQWGAVYLLPRSEVTAAGQNVVVTQEALRKPMLAFMGHLLALLGAPPSGPLHMSLFTLSRIRSADVLLRASSTLGSLARLAIKLPSIAIPRSVADGVQTALENLELACANLGTETGLRHARIAEEAAERAFFEKSMVGQLYFPDEHKIAVYLPLLGPVGVPLVIGLLQEVKGWISRRRQRRAAAAQKKAE